MKSFYLESDIEEIYNRLQEHRHLIDRKHFVLTGSNGFIGTYVQAVLSKFDNVIITAVDKNKPAAKISKVTYLDKDITDRTYYDLWEDGINHWDAPVNYILSMASIASPRVYKERPVDTLNVGYIGLQSCLDYMLHNKTYKNNDIKLLAFSSSEVYGTASIIPTPETYVGAIPTNSERSPYDISKLLTECMVYSYVKEHNLNASIVLPFNYFGSQLQDGRVMPSFMSNIVNNRPIEIFDGGRHQRTYSYIVDGIVGCLLALLKGKAGEKYNIGNPNDEISVLGLADRIEQVIERKIEKQIIEYPKDYAGSGNPTRRVPDIIKAQKELGYEPRVSLNEGIKRMYQWALENYKEE